ncbi:MAG: hypothetical protein N4A48_09785 [Tepidibacter sp.]|jgi:hypothetical protein|uniref:imm11 family protein n=1 Tax=Tepidibacter sp. TaxID=2529387 RepID=UPI0025EF1B19|nr:DUF1629 domain-containing protein [Tepidibacter sp.]MCT4509031.1 hypothetical protein [Tepidibacter sp.]
MDYFLLKQDQRYTKTPSIIELARKIDKRNINQLNAHKIEDTTILNIKADSECYFLDILDRQIYLISDTLKKLFEKYEPDIIFKRIAFIDTKKQKQKNYFLPIFEEIEALSSNSEFTLDKSVIKKVILDEKKINNRKIFKIKEGTKTLIVVRLDVAESILRRDFIGIHLEKLEIE